MFLRYSAKLFDNAREVKRSIVWSAWVDESVRYLTELETLGVQSQKLYADKQRRMLELDVEQLIRNIKVFVQHSTADEVIYVQDEQKTHLVEDLSTSERYLCVDGGSGDYIHDELREFSDRYICRIDWDKDAQILVKPTIELLTKRCVLINIMMFWKHFTVLFDS